MITNLLAFFLFKALVEGKVCACVSNRMRKARYFRSTTLVVLMARYMARARKSPRRRRMVSAKELYEQDLKREIPAGSYVFAWTCMFVR